MGSTGKKNSSTLEENELNYLLEKFSKDNSVASLDEYLNSAKQPAQPEKKAEKKAEKPAEKRQSPRLLRRSPRQSPLPLPQRQSSPRQTITTISTARRRTSSTRSARRRLSP